MDTCPFFTINCKKDLMHFNIFGYKKIKIHLLIKNCLTMFVALVSETKPSLSSMMASSALARLPSICRIWELVKPNQELTTRKVVWKKKQLEKCCWISKEKWTLANMLLIRLLWWILESMLWKKGANRLS